MKLSDLARMSPAEQDAAIESMAAAARSGAGEGSAREAARIRTFEERYEITSDEMVRLVAAGQMRETAEIAEWLFLLGGQRSRVGR
jgi:hypothetical protein